MTGRSRCGLMSAALAIAAAAPSSARAQSDGSITTTATSPRTLALAGVAVTPAAAADAAQTNPAALARLNTASATLAHRVVAPGVAAQSFVVAVPWRSQAVFAAGADVARADGVPTSSALAPGRDATYAARAGLSAAVRLPHGFAAGAGLARYASTLAVDSARGWCADAGLHWEGAGFRAGTALRGWSLAERAATDARAWSTGVARALGQVEVAAQLDGSRGGIGAGAAIAWRLSRALELRAGGRHHERDGDRFGAGISVGVAGARLEWGTTFARSGRTETAVGLALAFGSDASAEKGNAPAARDRQTTKPATPPAPGTAQPATPPAAAQSEDTTPPAPPAPPAAPRCFTVVSAEFPTLEAASKAIFKLRAVDLLTGVEQRGKVYVVVVVRCVSREKAADVQSRARRADVRTFLVGE